ncbi:DUF2393 family protein [Sulfurimonas sp.]|uniref:DUF2393 family protein n=1 Tax=Sulfurimonas sp. TaxID=2022749 RepID=UPI002AB086D9|nr:DUF2393 family protein [Sulfurimonas sp.]
MTTLNYWHFIVIAVILFIFAGGLYTSIKQENKKLIFPMIISVSLISVLLLGFSIVVVDKYTKLPKLYKMKNKRLLSIEKVVYTGIVKNEGNHEIGEVTFEIKLVNKGHVTGNVKGGSYFKASGFLDFFKGGSNILYKPQSITKEFVVARNLKPGQAKSFRVYFDWPPYFRSVSHFAKVYGH